MKFLLAALALLLGVGALTYLCGNHHREAIEADLTQQTVKAISLPDAKVTAEGQIITLEGTVPSEAAKKLAGDRARAVWGVEEVRNNLVVVPPGTMTREERKAAEDCQVGFNKLLGESTINFATGKAIIARSSYKLLDQLAETAKGCPAAKFEIGGHTDSRGKLESNMKLSQARADAVSVYLKGKGVAADRMTSAGYGPKQPVADNGTAEGMRKNRRTEFKVKGI